MTWYHAAYFVSILITFNVMGFIAWYSHRHRDFAGAIPYMWVSLLVSLLSLFEAISMIVPSRDWALFWFNMRFLSFTSIPVLWLIFVLQYSGKSNLVTKARITALFVIPAVTQIMMWTNDMHGLWVKQQVDFIKAGPFFIAETASRIPGLWYRVHLIYTYSIMLTGLTLLSVMSIHIYRQYRTSAIALGTGTLIMIIGSLSPAFNLAPGAVFNPMPQSFALGSLIIAWGIYRYRFLENEPLFIEEKRTPIILVILFILLTAGIISTGSIYYSQYEKNFRTGLSNQLSSIAELKANEIAQWRSERIGDANMLYGNPVFTGLVRRYFSDPADPEAERLIRIWLKKFQASYHYGVILLLDTNDKTRISVPHTTGEVCGYLLKQSAEIKRSGKIAFLDFHRDSPDKPIHLSVAFPVIDELTNRLLGLMAFYIDPADYLYPLINRWPAPSSTAETLLLRRDGNDVLFLNELRFRKNTALNLRISVQNDIVPAVMASRGKKGIVEGIDYRGINVIAAVLPVPDSPWFMVARMDITEVYAPLRSKLWSIITVICVLTAGAGTFVGLLWHRQSKRLYKERFKTSESLKESERKYRNLYNNAQVGLFETSLKDAKIIACNQRYCDMAGFPAIDSAIGMDVLQLYVNPADREEVKTILREKGDITNHTLQLKNRMTGGVFWAEFSARINQSRDVIEGTIIDITERKLAVDALRESELKFRETITNLDEGYYSVTPDGTIIDCNPAFNRILGIDISQDMKGSHIPDFWQNPDERRKYLNELTTHGFVRNYLINAKKNNGEKIVVIVNAHLVKNETGQVVRIEGTVMDFTERKRTEEEIIRINRIYAVISQINQMVIRTRERDTIFSEACRIAVEHGKFRMAWIGLLNEKEQTVDPVKWYGVEEGYLKKIRIDPLNDTPEGRGPTGTAIREGKFSCCNDIANDARMSIWRDEALKRGYRSSISLPIIVKSKTIGAFNIYASEPFFFNESEIRLLEEITGDIAYAVKMLETEEKVVESEARYRRLFETAKDSILILDADTDKIIDANPFIIQQTGYSLEEIQGKELWEIGLFSDKYLSKSFFDDLKKDRYIRYDNLPLLTKEGRALQVEFISNIYSVNHREVIQCNIRDITERKQIDAELRKYREHLEDLVNERANELKKSNAKLQSEIAERIRTEKELAMERNLLRTLIDCLPDEIYAKNSDSRFIVANARVLSTFNCQKIDDIIGKTDFDLLPQNEAVKYFTTEHEVLHSGVQTINYEKTITGPGGNLKWYSITKVPIKDSEGRVIGLVGINRDITGFKTIEENLQKAKEAAESANKAKSTFLSSMSHEIRTPLNAILGFSELIKHDSNLTKEQIEWLETITRSGEHLLALINDILEVSRIESGRISFNPSTFNIYSLLNEIEAMFRVSTDAKKLKLLMEYSGNLPEFIVTDESKLRQILINLVGNAVKFTKEGGIAIRVLLKKDDGIMHLVVEIEDTGPGIAEEEMNNLFQIFGQTESGIKEGGTGLGLALSYQYAKLMNGDIAVKSEEGKGTCFTMTIDIAEGKEFSKEKRRKGRVTGLISGQKAYRVLIADDRVDNLALLNNMLASAGFEVEEAMDGMQTIEKFKSNTPDIILMDMRMPVMNGYEAIRGIRAIEKKKTPIIAVTASAFQEDRQKALAEGADAYLRKPFKEHELFECLRLLLGVEYIYESTDLTTEE